MGDWDIQQWPWRVTDANHVCCRVCHLLLVKGTSCKLEALVSRLHKREDAVSDYPGFVKVATNVPHISFDEVVSGAGCS